MRDNAIDGPKWDANALAAFKLSVAAGLDPDDTGGKTWQVFSAGLRGVYANALPPGKLTRSAVLSLVSNDDVNIATVCAAIMAWGGMHMKCRDHLFSTPNKPWLDVAEQIRAGTLDRKQAYQELSELREEKSLKGAGPAYFTKLIYYLTPRDGKQRLPGYIMDQWAGCSINLLCGHEVVLMNVSKTWQWKSGKLMAVSSFTVSDKNTNDHYENFCQAADRLAKQFNLGTDQVDRALIGNGGKRPSPWREYVMDKRFP